MSLYDNTKTKHVLVMKMLAHPQTQTTGLRVMTGLAEYTFVSCGS